MSAPAPAPTPAETEAKPWYLTVMTGSYAVKDENGELHRFQGGPYEVSEFIAERAKSAAKKNGKIRIGHKPVKGPQRKDQRGTLEREDVKDWWADEAKEGRAAQREVVEKLRQDPSRDLGVSFPCPVDGCEDLEGNHSEYVTEAALVRHIEMNHQEPKGEADASQ